MTGAWRLCTHAPRTRVAAGSACAECATRRCQGRRQGAIDQGAPGWLENRGRTDKFGGRLRSGGGGPRDERGECAGGLCRQEREDEAGWPEDGLVAAQEGAKSAHIAGGRASANTAGRKGVAVPLARLAPSPQALTVSVHSGGQASLFGGKQRKKKPKKATKTRRGHRQLRQESDSDEDDESNDEDRSTLGFD